MIALATILGACAVISIAVLVDDWLYPEDPYSILEDELSDRYEP